MKVSEEFFSTLDSNNFELFAAQFYRNPQCTSPDEFYKDLKKLKSIRRQLSTYYSTDKKTLNERLLLNNIISFFNVFEKDCAIILMLHKIPLDFFPAIKAVLHFLAFIDINNELIEIQLDQELLTRIENTC